MSSLSILPTKYLKVQSSEILTTGLTIQEIKILTLCTQALSNKEIGDLLYISPLTVKKHRQNCYKKLGLHGKKEINLFLKKLYLEDNKSTP